MNFKIDCGVYPFDVMVSIGETNAVLKKKLDNLTVDYGAYFEKRITKGNCTMFISNNAFLLRFRSKYSPDLGCVAHEIFHCVTMLMDFIGMKFSLKHNDEAYAYLIGHLTTEFYKKYKPSKD